MSFRRGGNLVDFLIYTFNGVFIGLLYALIALGFIVIYRAGKILNLAQGELVVVGGFFLWWFLKQFNFPVWLGLIMAFACSIALGLIIERILFRPLIGQSLFTIFMVTVGLMILLRGGILVKWGPAPRAFPEIFSRAPIILGPLIFNRSILIGGLASLVIIAVISWLFEHTLWGLKLTAVAEDHQVAQSLGISVRKSIAIAWAIGGLLSTYAAIVFLNGRTLTFLASDIGMRALPVALLAGMQSIWGAPLAGIIIGVGEAWAGAYLDPYTNGSMSETFPFILMLVILLFRPYGLFGWRTIERV